MQRAHRLRHETTFEIGGVAEYFATATDEDDVRAALAGAQLLCAEVSVIAGGSNVLVADDGVSGLVLALRGGSWKMKRNVLHAQCGTTLHTLVTETAARGFGGWEHLAGIPGSLGGAIRGNAGAFGREIKDVLHRVRALHLHTGEVRMFSKEECAFAYRTSIFKGANPWVLLDAEIKLVPRDKKVAIKHAEETLQEREKKHLQRVKAAGSFFTNPVAHPAVLKQFETEKGVVARENRVPAGWLIEKAGLRGAREGGAISSMMHANYLVNETGEATAQEVWRLAQRIAKAVHQYSSITLTPEVSLLGPLDAFPPLV